MSTSRNLWSSRLLTDLRAVLVVLLLMAAAPLLVTNSYTLGILIVSI
jgi:hypothetical protein